MSRRISIGLGLFGVLAALPGSLAQAPPPLLPPSIGGTAPLTTPPAVVPAGTLGIPANAATEAPIRQFQPLDAFPTATQAAMKSYLQGATWLARMNQSQGRFQYGYLPALRQALEGEDDLKQAQAAYALAEAARFTGDGRLGILASQSVLALLTATRIDPADPACRLPRPTMAAGQRVGFAAVLALSIYALPTAEEPLVGEAERLCQFLRRQLQPNGSVAGTDDRGESAGFALHALAVSQRRNKPAPWKAEALQKGLTHYRGLFRSQPNPLLAATLTPALTEWYAQTPTAETAAFVFEMNDWLATLQYPATDSRHPLWMGGFRGVRDGRPVESPPDYECGLYLASLACACRTTRQVPDLARFGKYRQALLEGLPFLTGLQYTEANTRHFENSYRAGTLIGGFTLSPTDGNLRIDAAAHALTALLRFLQSGAERG